MRQLLFSGLYSGYSNVRIALDIGVALAHLSGRTLVPYRFRMPRRHPPPPGDTTVYPPMLVPELFEIPVPHDFSALMKTWVAAPGAVTADWGLISDAVFADAAQDAHDSRFLAFRNGRPRVLGFTPAQQAADTLHLQGTPLAQYSHFFGLDDARRREIVALMRAIQPRAALRRTVDVVLSTLGRFNAVHLRRGDFLTNDLSERGMIRTRNLSGREVMNNLAGRMARDDTLVVCTDGTAREDLFGPLQAHFRHTLFLDQHLRHDPVCRAAIAALPRFDEDVEALITQEVAARAALFAGTMYSTFTTLIHRLRALGRGETEFLYCWDDFRSPITRYDRGAFLPDDGGGPFSWNRLRYPVAPDAYSWFRAWPECAGLQLPGTDDGGTPPDGLLLPAAEGQRQGEGLRIAHWWGCPPVVLGWAAPDACLSWPVTQPTARTMAVEIRYSTGPDPALVGRYELGLAGQPPLLARTWPTLCWSTLSPWIALGRIQVPEGTSTLQLRPAPNSARHDELMAVEAVRLLPVSTG